MAILLDFGGTIFSAIHVDLANGGTPQKEYIRHLVINSLRHYNKMFRHEYGRMVVCMDSDSWRNGYFEFYKWVRRKERGTDGNDWSEIFEYVYEIQDDIAANLPFTVIKANGAEADDIIAHIATDVVNEPTVIVSNDKDLVALTQLSHVDHFRPIDKNNNKKFFTVEDPKRFEFELCLTGDKADGIPNVKCPDDFLKTQWETKDSGEKPPRAPAISAKLKEDCWNVYDGTPESLNGVLSASEVKNFIRNHELISFRHIPKDIRFKIDKAIKESNPANVMKTLAYLNQNKMNLLAKEISDFNINAKPMKTQSLF